MNKTFLTLLMIIVFAGVGCESINNTLDTKTKKGATLGALTGAAIGGIVGHNNDEHGWEGALIGGAAGAAGGGLIGHQMEKNDAPDASALSLVQLAEMGKSGVPSAVIISEIDRTDSEFELTAETISYLKDNGIADDVINHILNGSR